MDVWSNSSYNTKIHLHGNLAKGVRSHSLHNCFFYILSSIKIVCVLYELLLLDFVLFM